MRCFHRVRTASTDTKYFRGCVSTLIFCAILGIAASGFSAVLDQQYAGDPDLNFNIGEGSKYVAMVYTAGQTGSLAGVNIDVMSFNNDPLHVAIYYAFGDAPTSVLMGETVVNMNDGLSQLIAFPNSIPQIAGSQYGIVVNYLADPGAGQGKGVWGGHFSGPDGSTGYAGGMCWFSNDCASWWGNSYNDAYFRTYVDPASAVSVWKSAEGGSFQLASNWTNDAVPNGVDATAVFSNSIASPAKVTLDEPVVLGNLFFHSEPSYQILGPSSLTLQTSSGSANIYAEIGNHRIDAPVVLGSDAKILGPGIIELAGGISGDYTLEVQSSLIASSIVVDTLKIGAGGSSAAAVPEPSAIALLVAGTVGLLIRARPRKSKKIIL